MACFYPRDAWYSQRLNPNGKRSLVFKRNEGIVKGDALSISCGLCIGCRLERSRQWAIRCLHESSLYNDNCFVTLTYSPAFIPPYYSLVIRDVQLFVKKLRKRFSSDKIRFFLCGEYGESSKRPHYHALFFNLWFPDARQYGGPRNGFKVYHSDILDSLWGKGRAEFGSVTFESAAYVARYVCKKVLGSSDKAEALRDKEYGMRVDPSTGEVFRPRIPEFVLMSRRPGIGRPWLDRFKSDVFPRDFINLRGKKMRLPDFYSNILSLSDPDKMESLKRLRRASFDRLDNDSFRLPVKERIALSRYNLFSRSLGDDC
ncbi:MAG: replication initiator protein [Microviridae sp.]|nr:MAG: replication initiator protein [Microviridae sp.]